MGITPDGDRSKKWLWLARKKLAQCREIGLQSKSIKYNGFTISVKDLDGIDGGRVRAPMGAVILCTGSVDGLFDQKTRLMTADNWEGAFILNGYLNVAEYQSAGVATVFFKDWTDQDMIDAGVSIVPAEFYTIADYYPPTVLVDTYRETMPFPVVMPFKGGEAYWACHCGMFWNDVNLDDYPDNSETNHKFEAVLNYYAGNGAQLGGRVSLFQAVNWSDASMHCFQMIPASGVSFVSFQKFLSYFTSGGKRKIADYYQIGTETTLNPPLGGWRNWLLEDMDVDLPADLQVDINGANTSVKPVGSYSFALAKDDHPTILHCVDLTNTFPWHDGGFDEEVYFGSGDENWRLFYIFNTWPETGAANVFTVNASNFITLLDTLQGGDIIDGVGVIDWDLARLMMYQFFPYPNHNYFAPVDSVMFHDGDGNVYTWTRTYGAVKFAPTGMSSVALNIPAAAAGTEFVRPTISYCGIVSGSQMFVCISENIQAPARVVSAHYGSPLPGGAGWTELPAPPADTHLVYARPVKVGLNGAAALEVIMIGVLEDEITPGYNFAFLDYVAGVGEWKSLGRLPVTAGDYYTWSAGFFGEGTLVNALQEFLHPPPVLPQMPAGPDLYADYDQP